MYVRYTITVKNEAQMQDYCQRNGKSLSLLDTRLCLVHFCRGYILTSSSKSIVMDIVDGMVIVTLSLPVCPRYLADYPEETAMLNYFTYGADVAACINIAVEVTNKK